MGHFKRFVTRRDLPTLKLNLVPEWAEFVPSVHKCHAPSPMDVIMLCKEFWSSDALSHPPLLIFPTACLSKLVERPQGMCLRNKLSPVNLAEFRKTATKVQAAPWRMEAASAYLRQWCDQNEQQNFPPPEVLRFLTDKTEEFRWHRDLLAIADVEQQDDVWLRYAPGAPVAIAVHPAARKRSLIGGLGEPAGKKCKGKAKGKAKKPDPVLAGAAELLAPPPVPLHPDGGVVLDPSGPVPAPAVPERVVIGESGRPLGCPTCRYSKRGCGTCRNPCYKPRGPKRSEVARGA
jgi:hypothetical protein